MIRALVAGVGGLLALAPASVGAGALGAIRLPAPITIQTGYGRTAVSYQIATDGRARRIASPRSAFPPDAAWSPVTGNWFMIRRRHLVVGRDRTVLWRSHGVFTGELNVGPIQVGQRTIAFTYGGNLYMSPVAGSERLVGRSELPLGFTTGGVYTYQWGGRLLLRSDSGAVVATIARRPSGSGDLLAEDGSLYFVAGEFLQGATGASVHRLVALRSLGLGRSSVALQPVGDLLELQSNNRVVLLRRNGSWFASAPARDWGGGTPSGSPVVSARGNAVAFTTTVGQTSQTVYILREGAHSATAVYAHRAALGCEQGSGVQWHGHWLLYADSEGDVAAIDIALPDRTLDLTSLVRRLRVSRLGFTAFWSG